VTFDIARAKPLSAYSPTWTPSWVIDGLWQTRGVNMLYGAPRARKSTLNAYLTVCAITETTAFGLLKVTPIQRAAIFVGEGLVEAEATRYYDVLRAMQLDAAPYADRILFFGPDTKLRFNPETNTGPMLTTLRSHGYDFVSIDPLVNFHTRDENKTEMADVMAKITELTEFATVSLVHHSSKPSAEQGERSLSHQARGSSAIAGYTANNIRLDRSGHSDEHTLRTDAKYSADHGSLRLMFNDGNWTMSTNEDEKRLLEAVAKTPGLKRTVLVSQLGTRRNSTFALIKRLIEDKKLQENDLGGLEVAQIPKADSIK
jgi:AAA domain-containing protein